MQVPDKMGCNYKNQEKVIRIVHENFQHLLLPEFIPHSISIPPAFGSIMLKLLFLLR